MSRRLQTQPTSPSPPPTIDVDHLAKEKVNEIERQLTGLKFDTLNTWFSMLKQIITAADLHRTNDGKNRDENGQSKNQEMGDSIYADYGDDNEQFNAHMDLSEQLATNSVKWTIRVQAFKIVHRLVSLLSSSNDSSKPTLPVLTRMLPDLVRLAFVAATSPYDELKIQGFAMFKFLIEKFATMEEKEFPGHSILEQYKTQILSAVKPAFNLDAPPYITAIACQICSLWICYGLEKELGDVKRTYQLMSLSIDKLNAQGVNQHSKLYTESELEQERVDILGSWAQLYIASIESNIPGKEHGRLFRLVESECASLNSLIEPQVDNLVIKWWEALRDYALLITPSPKSFGTQHDSEHVYTREVALKLFEPVWPKLVLVQTYRLVMGSDKLTPAESKYVQFLCGIISKELCRYSISTIDAKQDVHSVMIALKSLYSMLASPRVVPVLEDNLAVSCEFYLVLYNITVKTIQEQPLRILLMSDLEQIFGIILRRISHEKSHVHYAIAKLISFLMNSMRDITIACRQDSHAELESLRIHLVIRLKSLVMIYLDAPRSSISEPPLQEALITVFQEMLRFDLDKSVSLSLISQLHHLYPVFDEVDRAHFIEELFSEVTNRIETISKSISDQLEQTNQYESSNMTQLDAFHSAIQHALRFSNAEGRTRLISSIIRIGSGVINGLVDKKSQLLEDKYRRELFDFFVNRVIAIRDEFPDELLCQETNQSYDLLIRLQQEIKRQIETKNEKYLESKKIKAKSNSKSQATKITLRADFSNFYASKK